MKTLYLVRHCKAEGQEADAPLTPEGVAQSNYLADLLANANIERIISSPYTRATQSITPLAQRLNLIVELEVRLVERVLCSDSRPDWQEHLFASFSDLDLRLEGGESRNAASIKLNVSLFLFFLLIEKLRSRALLSYGHVAEPERVAVAEEGVVGARRELQPSDREVHKARHDAIPLAPVLRQEDISLFEEGAKLLFLELRVFGPSEYQGAGKAQIVLGLIEYSLCYSWFIAKCHCLLLRLRTAIVRVIQT